MYIFMRIFLSIILNASILFIIWYLLNNDSHPEAVIITPEWIDAWKTYLLWGIVLWFLNAFVRPFLKMLWLPLFFLYPIITVIINALLLWMLSKAINDILALDGMQFQINGATNFIIAVAIFTILNMVYQALFRK